MPGPRKNTTPTSGSGSDPQRRESSKWGKLIIMQMPVNRLTAPCPPAAQIRLRFAWSLAVLRRLTLLLGWAVLMLPVTSTAQQPKAAEAVPKEGTGSLESSPPFVGVRYLSENRRDPFLNPLLLKKEGLATDEEMPPGQIPPGIAGTYIAQAVLVGIAAEDGSRTAVFRGNDNRVYFLHRGDKLFDGFIVNIGMDTVLLMRETKYRSGKVLRQEVTKRLRPL
jgi:hypothetical protein